MSASIDIVRPSPEALSRWIRADPVAAAEFIFGVKLWRAQRRILRAVFRHRRVTAKTCHKIGKSFVAAIIVILWMLAYPYRSIVTTTAPGQDQVRGIVWQNISALWERAAKNGIKFGAKPTAGRWQAGPGWFAQGIKPADHREDLFQGYNSDHSLVVCDEASGVSKNIIDGAKGMASNDGSALLLIGNAINASSEFARSFKMDSYHKITVSAFDTPNFKAAGVTREMVEKGEAPLGANGEPQTIQAWLKSLPTAPMSHLIGIGYARELIEGGGPAKTNSPYQSRVLAEFPAEADDVLIPYDWVRAAMARYGEVDPAAGATSIVSYDVAVSLTGDESVIGHRLGHRYRCIEAGRGWGVAEGAARARDAANEVGAHELRADNLGPGVGHYEQLEIAKEAGQLSAEHLRGFPAGASAMDFDPETVKREGVPPASAKYLNLRSQSWHHLSLLLNPDALTGEMPIEIESDPILEAQISNIKRTYDKKTGRIAVESKADMKTRGLTSPDRGDGLMMAFAPLPAPRPKGGSWGFLD